MKARNLLLWIMLGLCFAAFSCNKDEPGLPRASVITHVDPLWTYDLRPEPGRRTEAVANVIAGDVAVLNVAGGQTGTSIHGVDIHTGQQLWSWSNVYQPETEEIYFPEVAIMPSSIAWLTGTRHYCINTVTGEEEWRVRRERSYGVHLTTLGSSIFTSEGIAADNYFNLRDIVTVFDVGSGNITKRINPPYFSDSAGVRLEDQSMYYYSPTVWEGDTMLVFLLSDVGTRDSLNSNVAYLRVLNLSSNTWLYDEVQLNEPSLYGWARLPPQIHEGRVYASIGQGELVCHDLLTGKRLWRHKHGGSIFFSGFVVADGRLIAQSEDQRLHCYDARTGEKLWEREGVGTSSRLDGRYHKGIVYFAGGADRDIHAIDAATGNRIWRLDARNYGAEGFDRTVYLWPGPGGDEKGRLIVCTRDRAYCLETIR